MLNQLKSLLEKLKSNPKGQIETKEKLLTDLKQRKALLPTEGQEEINQEIKEQEELLEELKKQEQRERLIWESQVRGHQENVDKCKKVLEWLPST
ncbi:15696_t:CDS:2, partial [Racocetra fulgida]